MNNNESLSFNNYQHFANLFLVFFCVCVFACIMSSTFLDRLLNSTRVGTKTVLVPLIISARSRC